MITQKRPDFKGLQKHYGNQVLPKNLVSFRFILDPLLC